MSQTVQTDRYTGAQWSIESEHGLIHDERMWNSSYPNTNIAVSGATYFLLRCHDREVHFVYTVGVDKYSRVELYEGPTVNAVGNAQAILNVKRESTETTNVLCYNGSTIGADGSHLDSHILGGAEDELGGRSRGGLEWVGLANEDYVLKVITTENDTVINVGWRFYEEL